MEKKVLIYVRDEAYGRRLLEYLETRHSGGIDWELVTERGFERRKDEKGVWLTDDPGQTEDEDKKVWYLTASNGSGRRRDMPVPDSGSVVSGSDEKDAGM